MATTPTIAVVMANMLLLLLLVLCAMLFMLTISNIDVGISSVVGVHSFVVSWLVVVAVVVVVVFVGNYKMMKNEAK